MWHQRTRWNPLQPAPASPSTRPRLLMAPLASLVTRNTTQPKCPITWEDPASYGHVETGHPPATRKSEAPYTSSPFARRPTRITPFRIRAEGLGPLLRQTHGPVNRRRGGRTPTPDPGAWVSLPGACTCMSSSVKWEYGPSQRAPDPRDTGITGRTGRVLGPEDGNLCCSAGLAPGTLCW